MGIAPKYTTDLTDWIADTDTTAWSELQNAISGGNPDEADTESALQGTNTVSQSCNTTNRFSLCRILGASTDLTGYHVMVWHGHGVATALLSYASDGLLVAFASSTSNWKAYTVGGNDVPPFPYGKWVNNAVDPSGTADLTNGTAPNVNAISGIGSMGQQSVVIQKGQPHVCDMIRYGLCEARFTGGDIATTDYGTFAGFAAQNDTSSNRWGLLQETAGGYLWKGKLKLGMSSKSTSTRARASNVATLVTTVAHELVVGDAVNITKLPTAYNGWYTVASVPNTTTFTYANTGSDESTTSDGAGDVDASVDFRDSNKTIFVQDCRKTAADFNLIEVNNIDSNVSWTGITISNLSPTTTASLGDFECKSVITHLTMDGCTFVDLGTFTFLNGDITDTVFRRCGQISYDNLTTDTWSGNTVTNSTASSAMITSTPGYATTITNTTFISDGTGHALEVGGTAADFTLTGNTYSGYAVTDGSTGNEAVYVNISTGSLTISINGGDTPTIRTAGATVTVENTVNIVLSNLIAGSRVYIRNTTDSTDLFNEIEATTTFSDSVNYTADKSLLIRVRNASGSTKYKPFETTGTLTSSGFTLQVNQELDE